MQETTWQIETPDGHRLYGVRNGTGTALSAVFMVHGLTGHMHEYALKRAADHFAPTDDVYRFNLYAGEPKARRLLDCTIQTHADDLNQVLEHFAPQYERIFLIGHSYGGPTVMMANPACTTAASLWDPTFDCAKVLVEEDCLQDTYLAATGAYAVEWGVTSLIGRAMHDEARRLNREACCALARDFRAPVQVVHAGNGLFARADVSYHTYGDPRNRRDVVEGTVHCFHEGNTCDVLLARTADWFRPFRGLS